MSDDSSLPSGRPGVPGTALPTDKELVLKVIPMPADSNANGDIFGGWVMAQCDLAGSVIPARHAKGRMATVAMRPLTWRAGITEPARSTWAITQPPKMSPLPLVSAGIGMTFSTSSLSEGRAAGAWRPPGALGFADMGTI